MTELDLESKISGKEGAKEKLEYFAKCMSKVIEWTQTEERQQ